MEDGNDDLHQKVRTLQAEMETIQRELREASRVRLATLLLVALGTGIQIIGFIMRFLDK